MDRTSQRHVAVVGVIGLALTALLLVLAGPSATTAGELATQDHHHDHGPPDVEVLTTRSSSPDAISAQLRLRLDGTGATNVMNVRDVDHLQLVKLTFAPGDAVDWHVHPGPVIVIVDKGVLTVTSASDCTARDYGPSEVYLEPGDDDVLRVENRHEAESDTVIYALFLDLPEDGPLTLFRDAPDC